MARVDHLAFAPGPTLFRHFIEEAQGQAGSVYGRLMYEVMRYWDDDQPEWEEAERAVLETLTCVVRHHQTRPVDVEHAQRMSISEHLDERNGSPSTAAIANTLVSVAGGWLFL